MDKAQWKVVPVEPTPEMIAAAYAGGHGGGPAADYAAMLAAAPQPPSASGERDPDRCAQEVFDTGHSVGLFDLPKDVAEAICAGVSSATGARIDWHYIGGRVHMKALPALAVASPGIDAAEQKPVYTIQVRGALHTWEPTAQAFKLTNGTYNLYAAPSPAASADEWMAEAEALLDAYAASIRRFVMNQEVAKHQAGCRAALLAHLKAWP